MNINLLRPPKYWLILSVLIVVVVALNHKASIGYAAPLPVPRVNLDTLASLQTTAQASTSPKSILFPSGSPGPYIPPVESRVDDTFPSENPIPNNGSDINNRQDTATEIEINEIEQADTRISGLISVTENGFPVDMWRGNSFEQVEQLFNTLTLPVHSPAMDGLLRKLLLSLVYSPGSSYFIENSQSGDANNSNISSNLRPDNDSDVINKFSNLRAIKLAQRGHLTDLAAFLQSVPQDVLNITKSNAEIRLLVGDLLGACQMTRDVDTSQSEPDGQFWLKMLAFCRVLEDNNSGAQIALDMMNEQGNIDFIFFDLLSLLMERPESRVLFNSSGITEIDPLNYTILSLLEQPIEADLIEKSSPRVLGALVTNPNISNANRYFAASRSYLSGGIPVNILGDIYDLQIFTTSEYENAIAISENDERPINDVLLYQSAAKQISDINKAEVLKAISQRSSIKHDLPRSAMLNRATLSSLTPSASLVEHATHVTRGLILGGELNKANNWYEFVRDSATSGDPRATSVLINIWPLIIMANDQGEIPWSDEILDLWWNGQMLSSSDDRDFKAALFYSLLEAFQYKVSEEKWSQIINGKTPENTHAIPLGTWRAMIKAVEEEKYAETVLLSLIAMGEGGPGKLDASGISAVVRALRSVGLEKEARNIALEALVGYGF